MPNGTYGGVRGKGAKAKTLAPRPTRLRVVNRRPSRMPMFSQNCWAVSPLCRHSSYTWRSCSIVMHAICAIVYKNAQRNTQKTIQQIRGLPMAYASVCSNSLPHLFTFMLNRCISRTQIETKR